MSCNDNRKRWGKRRDDNPQVKKDLARIICRELYDRFVMGGWEPQDAHDWVEMILDDLKISHAIQTHNERSGVKA